MQKYRVISKLGSGAFGSVEKAENKQTKQIVAIKKLKRKYSTWDECLQLAEVKALRKLMHPNIIKLKELIRHNTDAYFVFEYIDKDLFKLTQSLKEKGKQINESDIKNIAWQVAHALSYIHKQGFFHRDLKPENLLISQDNTVKLIDFGLAKEIRSKPPFTDYVSTRWYRAPEILLRSSTYSSPVDVFAFGCVLAELYLMKPLFMGTSEIDQLSKICSLMGTPTAQDWSQGLKLANLKGYNFPQYQAIPLSTVFPTCSSEGINLIGECLKFDPFKRITMPQVLNHPYFKGVKFEVKQKEQDKINPFEKVSDKQRRQSPSKINDISENEFDALLNDLSGNSIKQDKKRLEQSAEDYEEVDKSIMRLKLVEPIQPNIVTSLKESTGLSIIKDVGYGKSKVELKGDKEYSYGTYMPSFGEGSSKDNPSVVRKKGSLGMFGLESIKR